MANSHQAGPTKVLYLDDLHVGQRFTSDTHLIDEEQIKAFAKQFDPQPFHLDAEAAKGTLFEGLVASGWHTVAITMRLLVESGMPIAGGVISSTTSVAHRQETLCRPTKQKQNGRVIWPQAAAGCKSVAALSKDLGGC
jgi:acyl dehydratase